MSKPLLAHRQVLARCFGPGALLAFDYDGTLAPIAAHPSDAHMRVRTRRLLANVAEHYRVVVISGRSRSDVMRFVGGIRLFDVYGNHGVETVGLPPADIARHLARWRRQLNAVVCAVPGMWVEDKGWSLSVHYRNVLDNPEGVERLHKVAAQLEHVRLLGGKEVLNLLPLGAPDKGDTLATLRQQLGQPALLFVGDDETDETVFTRLGGGDAVSVRVGFSPESRAEYFLAEQSEIDSLLEMLDEGARSRCHR